MLFCAAFTSVQAQIVTVSNNLLYDATLTPNLRVGLRLAPHWSLGMMAGYRPWPTDDAATRKLRHLLLSPSVRYWTDSVNVHHFFGANVIYSHYNVGNIKFPFGLYKSVRDERRQGDLVALGTYSAATGTAVDGVTYYEKLDVQGVDIRGNVYGGGNNAEVTGDAKVKIGQKEDEGD